MKRNSRKVVMGSLPSSSYSPPPNPNLIQPGEQARARLKHQALLQDYHDLFKEFEAKKNILQNAIEKKHRLIAEVKFLRRKYNSFSIKNSSQGTLYRVKKQSHKMLSPSVRITQAQNRGNQKSDFPSKNMDREVKGAAIQNACGLLDLNQISQPSTEEMNDFPTGWEPLKEDAMKRIQMEANGMTNDFKLSVVRDVGNGSSRVGKRKISWQDQVALRA